MTWYRTFFEGVPQRAWKLGQTIERDELEAEFLWDMLYLGEGDKVLDIFSGYGRHAIPLARNKVEMWCVDISPESCEELSVESREQHLGIQVLCGDFLEAPLPPVEMDAAYCMGNSLCFFNRTTMPQFLSKIASALKEDAPVMLHSALLAESVLPHFQLNEWMHTGQGEETIYYLAYNEYDPIEGIIRAEITYLENGKRHPYRIEQHIYTLSEIKNMCENAGLFVEGVYSALDAEPYRLGDEEAFILLRKSSPSS